MDSLFLSSILGWTEAADLWKEQTPVTGRVQVAYLLSQRADVQYCVLKCKLSKRKLENAEVNIVQ